MTRKKNGFFTFCFSLIPGAGEMYMGFFKQGISLMTIFFLITALAGYLNIEYVMLFQPVIWFYSFFHVHNLKSMPDDEFYALEDDFLFHADRLFDPGAAFWKKYRKIMALLLVFFGFSILWNTVNDLIRSLLRAMGIDNLNFLYRIQNAVPQLIIAVGIIAAGIFLIKNKSEELHKTEEAEKEEPYLIIDQFPQDEDSKEN